MGVRVSCVGLGSVAVLELIGVVDDDLGTTLVGFDGAPDFDAGVFEILPGPVEGDGIEGSGVGTEVDEEGFAGVVGAVDIAVDTGVFSDVGGGLIPADAGGRGSGWGRLRDLKSFRSGIVQGDE